MNGNDRIQLRHMSNAAREAISFAEGRTRNDLEHDRQLVPALARATEIVDEAASRTTLATRNDLPDISKITEATVASLPLLRYRPGIASRSSRRRHVLE